MFDYVPINTVQDLARPDSQISETGEITNSSATSFTSIYSCPYTDAVYVVLDDSSVQILGSNVYRRFKKPCLRLEITKFAVFYIDVEDFVMILNKHNLCNLDLPRIQNCRLLATYENFFAISSSSQPKVTVFAQTARNKLEKVTEFRCQEFPQCLAISRQYCAMSVQNSYFFCALKPNAKWIETHMPAAETPAVFSTPNEQKVFTFSSAGGLLMTLQLPELVATRTPMQFEETGAVYTASPMTFYTAGAKTVSIGELEEETSKVSVLTVESAKSVAKVKSTVYICTDHLLWEVKPKPRHDILYEAAKERLSAASTLEAYEAREEQSSSERVQEIKELLLEDIWTNRLSQPRITLKTHFIDCMTACPPLSSSYLTTATSTDLQDPDLYELLLAYAESASLESYKFMFSIDLGETPKIAKIPENLPEKFIERQKIIQFLLQIRDKNFENLQWVVGEEQILLTESFSWLPEADFVDFVANFPPEILQKFIQYRRRHVKLLPDLEPIIQRLDENQKKPFLTEFDNLSADDQKVLEKSKIQELFQENRHIEVLTREFKISDEERSAIESVLSPEVLVEYYLGKCEYLLAFQQCKRVHANDLDLLGNLLSFCESVPKAKVRRDILMDVLLNETVSIAEAHRVVNQFSKDLALMLPEILEQMPELSGVLVRDFKSTFNELNRQLLTFNFIDRTTTLNKSQRTTSAALSTDS